MRIILVVDHKGTPNPVVEMNWNAVPSVGDQIMYSGELLEVVGVEWHVCAEWEDLPLEFSTWIPYARVTIAKIFGELKR